MVLALHHHQKIKVLALALKTLGLVLAPHHHLVLDPPHPKFLEPNPPTTSALPHPTPHQKIKVLALTLKSMVLALHHHLVLALHHHLVLDPPHPKFLHPNPPTSSAHPHPSHSKKTADLAPKIKVLVLKTKGLAQDLEAQDLALVLAHQPHPTLAHPNFHKPHARPIPSLYPRRKKDSARKKEEG